MRAKKIVSVHKLITENGFRYPLENVIDFAVSNIGVVDATIFDDMPVVVGADVEDNYPNGLDPREVKRSGDLYIKFAGGVNGRLSLLLHVWDS